MSDCIFCKIVVGGLPASKIYEDEKTLVFLSIDPVNKGHALVIPKEHYRDCLDTPSELLAYLMQVAQRVAQAVKQATGADGINFGINNGAAAGQLVFHTHLHIIPRFNNDGLHSWPDKEYKDIEEQEAMAQKIKEVLN